MHPLKHKSKSPNKRRNSQSNEGSDDDFLTQTIKIQNDIKNDYQFRKIKDFYSNQLDEGMEQKLQDSMLLLKKYWITLFLFEAHKIIIEEKHDFSLQHFSNLISNYNSSFSIRIDCKSPKNPRFEQFADFSQNINDKLLIKFFVLSLIPSFYNFFLTKESDNYFNLITAVNDQIRGYLIQTIYLIPGFVEYVRVSLKETFRETTFSNLTAQEFLPKICLKLHEKIYLCPKYCLRFFNHKSEEAKSRVLGFLLFVCERPELFQLHEFYQAPLPPSFKVTQNDIENIDEFNQLVETINQQLTPTSDQQNIRNITFGQFRIYNSFDINLLTDIDLNKVSTDILSFLSNPESQIYPFSIQYKERIPEKSNNNPEDTSQSSTKIEKYQHLLLISEPLPLDFRTLPQNTAVSDFLRPFLVDQGNLMPSDEWDIPNGFIERKSLFESVFSPSDFDTFRSNFISIRQTNSNHNNLKEKLKSIYKMRKTVLRLQSLMNHITADTFHLLNFSCFKSVVNQQLSTTKRKFLFWSSETKFDLDTNLIWTDQEMIDVILHPKLIQKYDDLNSTLCQNGNNTGVYRFNQSDFLNIASDSKHYLYIKLVENISFARFKEIRNGMDVLNEVFINIVNSFDLSNNKLVDTTKKQSWANKKILAFLSELAPFKNKIKNADGLSEINRDLLPSLSISTIAPDGDSFSFLASSISPDYVVDNSSLIKQGMENENNFNGTEFDAQFNELKNNLFFAFSSDTNPYQKLVDIVEAFNDIIKFILINSEIKSSDQLTRETALYLLDVIISIIPPSDFVSAFVFIFDYWILLVNDESNEDIRDLFVRLFNFAMNKRGNHDNIIYGEEKLYKNLLMCRENRTIAVFGNPGESIRNKVLKRLILENSVDTDTFPIEEFLDSCDCANLSFFEKGKYYDCKLLLNHQKKLDKCDIYLLACKSDDPTFQSFLDFISNLAKPKQIFVLCPKEEEAAIKSIVHNKILNNHVLNYQLFTMQVLAASFDNT